MDSFEKELSALINKHSIENESNTPDWLLAQYLISCLAAFTVATQQRETWYGRDARRIVKPLFREIKRKQDEEHKAKLKEIKKAEAIADAKKPKTEKVKETVEVVERGPLDALNDLDKQESETQTQE